MAELLDLFELIADELVDGCPLLEVSHGFCVDVLAEVLGLEAIAPAHSELVL